MSMSSEIAAWIGDLRYEDLPTEVVRVATRAHLDTIGVILAGLREPVTQVVREVLIEEGARPVASHLGSTFRTSMASAALLNGVSSHALDYDDVSLSMIGHPSAVLVPAVLAVAEATGASGAKVIEGYVAGFELVAKLGSAVGMEHYRLGWHATSTLGTLGAAAAAGKVLGLGEEALVHALAVAVSMASGSRRNFGTMVKPFHPGHAARCGVEAALLARHGLRGDREALEATYGFFDLFTRGGVEPAAVAGQLGRPYDLVTPGLNVKRYPCCYNTHRAADAVLALAEQVRPDDVQRVQVTVPLGGLLPLIHPRPQTGLEGKFSMEYVVAAALLDGALTLHSFSDVAVQRSAAQDLLRKVTTVEDPGMKIVHTPVDEGYVEVSVATRQGRELVHRVTYPVGSSELPLPWHELVAKFSDCAGDVLDDGRIERAVACIATLGQQSSLSDLVGTLTPATRSEKS